MKSVGGGRSRPSVVPAVSSEVVELVVEPLVEPLASFVPGPVWDSVKIWGPEPPLQARLAAPRHPVNHSRLATVPMYQGKQYSIVTAGEATPAASSDATVAA